MADNEDSTTPAEQPKAPTKPAEKNVVSSLEIGAKIKEISVATLTSAYGLLRSPITFTDPIIKNWETADIREMAIDQEASYNTHLNALREAANNDAPEIKLRGSKDVQELSSLVDNINLAVTEHQLPENKGSPDYWNSEKGQKRFSRIRKVLLRKLQKIANRNCWDEKTITLSEGGGNQAENQTTVRKIVERLQSSLQSGDPIRQDGSYEQPRLSHDKEAAEKASTEKDDAKTAKAEPEAKDSPDAEKAETKEEDSKAAEAESEAKDSPDDEKATTEKDDSKTAETKSETFYYLQGDDILDKLPLSPEKEDFSVDGLLADSSDKEEEDEVVDLLSESEVVDLLSELEVVDSSDDDLLLDPSDDDLSLLDSSDDEKATTEKDDSKAAESKSETPDTNDKLQDFLGDCVNVLGHMRTQISEESSQLSTEDFRIVDDPSIAIKYLQARNQIESDLHSITENPWWKHEHELHGEETSISHRAKELRSKLEEAIEEAEGAAVGAVKLSELADLRVKLRKLQTDMAELTANSYRAPLTLEDERPREVFCRRNIATISRYVRNFGYLALLSYVGPGIVRWGVGQATGFGAGLIGGTGGGIWDATGLGDVPVDTSVIEDVSPTEAPISPEKHQELNDLFQKELEK